MLERQLRVIPEGFLQVGMALQIILQIHPRRDFPPFRQPKLLQMLVQLLRRRQACFRQLRVTQPIVFQIHQRRATAPFLYAKLLEMLV